MVLVQCEADGSDPDIIRDANEADLSGQLFAMSGDRRDAVIAKYNAAARSELLRLTDQDDEGQTLLRLAQDATLEVNVEFEQRQEADSRVRDLELELRTVRGSLSDQTQRYLDATAEARKYYGSIRDLERQVEKERERIDEGFPLSALPDDLRALGWSVAVHNDYRLNGEAHTFWLLTKDGRALKGEGRTDWQALNQIRVQVVPPPAVETSGATGGDDAPPKPLPEVQDA